MKKGLIIVIVVIVVLVVGGIIGFNMLAKTFDERLSAITIDDVDIEKVADGEYVGESSTVVISVKTKVTVKNGKITDIEIIKHNNGQGEDAERIVDDVIEAQSLQVDAITGATSSSTVILDAIENALKQ